MSRKARKELPTGWDRWRNQFVSSVAGVDSHRRLAAGLVLGMALGLAPKWTLTTVLVGLATLFSTANLLTALIGLAFGCGAIMAAAGPLENLFRDVGVGALKLGPVREMVGAVAEQPVGAWLGWEDPMVLGTWVTCLIAGLPAFLLASVLFKWYRPRLVSWLERWPSTRWMLGSRVS